MIAAGGKYVCHKINRFLLFTLNIAEQLSEGLIPVQ